MSGVVICDVGGEFYRCVLVKLQKVEGAGRLGFDALKNRYPE